MASGDKAGREIGMAREIVASRIRGYRPAMLRLPNERAIIAAEHHESRESRWMRMARAPWAFTPLAIET